MHDLPLSLGLICSNRAEQVVASGWGEFIDGAGEDVPPTQSLLPVSSSSQPIWESLAKSRPSLRPGSVLAYSSLTRP